MLKSGNTRVLAQNLNPDAHFNACEYIDFCKIQSFKLMTKFGADLPTLDFTISLDNFLIVLASVDRNQRSVPLYFSMPNDPEINQKNMKEAFIKELILSKNIHTVIVPDRGFGNQRFARLCQENGYVLRMNESLVVQESL